MTKQKFKKILIVLFVVTCSNGVGATDNCGNVNNYNTDILQGQICLTRHVKYIDLPNTTDN